MTDEAKGAIRDAIDDAVLHLRDTAAALSTERDEALALAQIAKDTGAEVIAGTLSVENGKRNVARLANALKSNVLASAYHEKAAQIEWFRAWSLRVLDIAAAVAL